MSFSELLIISIAALLLFGPRKLPEMARILGKTMAELRRAANEFRYSLEEEVRNIELQEQLKSQAVETQALPAAPPTAEQSVRGGAPAAVEGTVARDGADFYPAADESHPTEASVTGANASEPPAWESHQGKW
jgi:sec-independent protein translocase protein TatB